MSLTIESSNIILYYNKKHQKNTQQDQRRVHQTQMQLRALGTMMSFHRMRGLLDTAAGFWRWRLHVLNIEMGRVQKDGKMIALGAFRRAVDRIRSVGLWLI